MLWIYFNTLFSTIIENEQMCINDDVIEKQPTNLSSERNDVYEFKDTENYTVTSKSHLKVHGSSEIFSIIKKISNDIESSFKTHKKLPRTLLSDQINDEWLKYKSYTKYFLKSIDKFASNTHKLNCEIYNLQVKYYKYVNKSKNQFVLCQKAIENLLTSIQKYDDSNLISKDQLVFLSVKIWLLLPPTSLFGYNSMTKREKILRFLFLDKIFKKIENVDLLFMSETLYNEPIGNDITIRYLHDDYLFQKYEISNLLQQIKIFIKIRDTFYNNLGVLVENVRLKTKIPTEIDKYLDDIKILDFLYY